MMNGNISGAANNIIVNYDFSNGLHSWHTNCSKCDGYAVSKPGGNYAVVTNRKEFWQGLEQDITARISAGSTYKVSAFVGVSGTADAEATLKIKNQASDTTYLCIGMYTVFFFFFIHWNENIAV